MKNKIVAENNALLNVITPIGGLEFMRNGVCVGENLAKIYVIIKYPPTIDMGWSSKISNISRAIVCQVFEPCNNAELLERLSRSVNQNKGVAESTRDALQKRRAEKAAEDADTLIVQIDQLGETVGYITTLIMPIAKSEAVLTKACRRVESVMATMKCKARVLANLQKEAYKAISPYHISSEKISNIAKRNMPFSSFAGGFPFASSGFTDREGYYFAKDSQGGLIILNPWIRNDDRTNCNFVIMGVPGVGKSTAAKSIILCEFMLGTKIICIDPQKEYVYMCSQLGGDYINCAGGHGKVNPLQIKPVPLDEEELQKYTYEGIVSPLALHFGTLNTFFSLYMPDMTAMQYTLLKILLENTYKEFGITWLTDISAFKSEDFPTFSDLYRHVKASFEENKDNEDLKFLMAMIRELAEGADSFLFNGHTTIDSKTRFLCLDTSLLKGSSKTIKRTQYFNLLTWVWEQMSKDRKERVMLVADEAYLLVDEQVPQSLEFLYNTSKQARKYEAGVGVISHSVVDFLDHDVKKEGQSLLDLPTYKILMGTDGKNLKETTELFGLTENEQEHLSNKIKKHAIFFAGSKRLFVKFDIPDYRLDKYIGQGGGR